MPSGGHLPPPPISTVRYTGAEATGTSASMPGIRYAPISTSVTPPFICTIAAVTAGHTTARAAIITADRITTTVVTDTSACATDGTTMAGDTKKLVTDHKATGVLRETRAITATARTTAVVLTTQVAVPATAVPHQGPWAEYKTAIWTEVQ